jgi:hypothetical protein
MVDRYESCVLMTGDNSVKCWGGTIFAPVYEPIVKPDFPSNLLSFSSGSIYLGTVPGGGVKCWAPSNIFAGNPCGNGASDKGGQYVVDVTGLTTGVTKLASNYNSSCAILTDGSVRCWGYWWNNTNLPVVIQGLGGTAVDIAVGGPAFFTPQACAVLSSGAVKCWGGDSQMERQL